jgi:hypothetical protein
MAVLLLAAAPAAKPCPEAKGKAVEKFDRELTNTNVKEMVEAINAQGIPDLFPRPLVASKVVAVFSFPRVMQGRGYFHLEVARVEDVMSAEEWTALKAKATKRTREQLAELKGWTWSDPLARHRHSKGGPPRLPCGDQPIEFYFTEKLNEDMSNHGVVRGVALFAGGNAVFFEEVW